MKPLQKLIRLEYLLLAAAIYVAYVVAGFAWYWPFVLFLAFDIGMVGYLLNTKIGAVVYNLSHSFAIPALVLMAFFIFQNEILLFISLLWLFHITVDRTFGYGLKHSDSFHHTHLGNLKK